ncbi:MAG: hypothetical protein IJS08_07980 [Victivallales bacterium]|nr:hypothetical protein [Victivallales bacterium]
MPQAANIKCEQQWEGDSLQMSRLGKSGKSATQHWLVSGADSEEKALDALRDHINQNKLTKYMGMLLQSLQVAERATPETWKIDVTYSRTALNGLDEDDSEGAPKEVTNYSTSTTTVHVTHSLKTVRRYAAANGGQYGGSSSSVDIPDYKGAMCVVGDEVQGTDINFATQNFTITHYFKKRQWSTRLRNKILNSVNRMNSREFRGFDPGSVLYLGTSQITPVEVGGEDYIQVDFTFAYSPNDDDVELPDWTGNSIKKEGWNLMWVRDGKTPDGHLVPKYVYVEQVYKTLDFTTLGLKAKE